MSAIYQNDEWYGAEGGEGQTIQVNTLPTAGADQVGKVYQYIGVTNVNYTHGYFYECTTDGTTYEWTQTDTQPGGSGHTIKDEGTALTQRNVIDFTDFDISDDSTNEETDVAPHRLTSAELAEIVTPLPAVPVNGINYSTEEQVIGTWIDGKPLYQKTVTIGQMPNHDSKIVAHGVSDIDSIVDFEGIWWRASDGYSGKMPTASPQAVTRSISLNIDKTNINIDTLADYSMMDNAYVTMRYTKTTDVAP